MIYLIGSLRNPAVPGVAKALRGAGFVVFDEWYAAGPQADDAWRDYEKARKFTYAQALCYSAAAEHVFSFDKENLLRADAAVLVLPAGKSAHLELGWMLGRGKPGFILLDQPERWDVMYKFATGVVSTCDDLVLCLKDALCPPTT